MKTKYQLGEQFVTSDDIEFLEGIIPKQTIFEITEINPWGDDENQYKVTFHKCRFTESMKSMGFNDEDGLSINLNSHEIEQIRLNVAVGGN